MQRGGTLRRGNAAGFPPLVQCASRRKTWSVCRKFWRQLARRTGRACGPTSPKCGAGGLLCARGGQPWCAGLAAGSTLCEIPSLHLHSSYRRTQACPARPWFNPAAPRLPCLSLMQALVDGVPPLRRPGKDDAATAAEQHGCGRGAVAAGAAAGVGSGGGRRVFDAHAGAGEGGWCGEGRWGGCVR